MTVQKFAPFSVLMSVYSGDSIEQLRQAVQSNTVDQQLAPLQMVIVRDGQVSTEIQQFLNELKHMDTHTLGGSEISARATSVRIDSVVDAPHTTAYASHIANPRTTAYVSAASTPHTTPDSHSASQTPHSTISASTAASTSFTIVELEHNQGLAHALNIGLTYCAYDVVARADSDDISLPERYRQQIPLLLAPDALHNELSTCNSCQQQSNNIGDSNNGSSSNVGNSNGDSSRDNSNNDDINNKTCGSITKYANKRDNSNHVDIVGTAIQEFTQDSAPDSPIIRGQIRLLPESGAALVKFAKIQSPLHHPSVAFRKTVVQSVGGYPEQSGRFEDYLLWERLILAHASLYNLQDVLVLYRVDAGAYQRRGGLAMFMSELHLQQDFLHDRFITPVEFMRNVCVRAGYRLVPTSLRTFVYRILVALRNRH